MEKDLKIFTINYFCPLRCPISLCFIGGDTSGPWFGLVFSCSKWCWKWSFHFPESSFPFWGSEIEPGGLSPPFCFSEWRAGALIPSTSSQSPLWQGQVSEGPGTGRKGWFISGIKTELVFIFPSPLENTKMQIPCPGFCPITSHRIFHRVHSSPRGVVRPELCDESIWRVWKKWHLHIHYSAIRGEYRSSHILMTSITPGA